MTVKDPMPPSTRFFKVSVPVGPAVRRHTLAFSRALCPCSPQILGKVKRMGFGQSELNIWSEFRESDCSVVRLLLGNYSDPWKSSSSSRTFLWNWYSLNDQTTNWVVWLKIFMANIESCWSCKRVKLIPRWPSCRRSQDKAISQDMRLTFSRNRRMLAHLICLSYFCWLCAIEPSDFKQSDYMHEKIQGESLSSFVRGLQATG